MYKLNKARIVWGLLTVSVFALIGMQMKKQAERNLYMVENASVLTRAALEKIQPGEPVAIIGRISARTPAVVNDLVFACEEHYGGSEDGWEFETEYANTLIIAPPETVKNQSEIQVHTESPCPNGIFTVQNSEHSGAIRWVGYVAEQPIVMIAERLEHNSPPFESLSHWGGTQAEVLGSIQGGILVTRFIVGFAVLFGLVIMFWPERSSE